MINKDIKALALDISLENNSFFVMGDEKKIEEVLHQAEKKGELEKIAIKLRHNDIDGVKKAGYNIIIDAYEEHKKNPIRVTVNRNHNHYPSDYPDYEGLILARQEEMWQD